MMLNEPGRQKLETQIFWQQAKHGKLFPTHSIHTHKTLEMRLDRGHLIAVDTHQKGP